MYDVIKEPMDNIIKEPMDNVGKKNNHINDYTSTLTHGSTDIDSNNLENLGYSIINQNNTNSLDGSYEDYLWLNNNDSNEFDGFSLESYEQPENKLYVDENGKKCYSFSSKPDNILTYQKQQYNNYSNNTQVHYVLQQPNYETLYNTNSTLYPYSYYNGEFYL